MNLDFFINDESCPLINALFIYTGEMYVLESSMGKTPRIRILCKSTIESYFEYNDTKYVTYYTVTNKVELKKYVLHLGEGGFGADGIVYLIDKEKEKVLWFLFLDNSNPFDTAIMNDENIIVKSTKNISFNIPIEKPELISIIGNGTD